MSAGAAPTSVPTSTEEKKGAQSDNDVVAELAARILEAVNLGSDEPDEAPRPRIPPKREVYAAYEHYKSQLMLKRRSQLPAEIPVVDPRHADIFNRVLRNHPNSIGKIGCGLKEFKIKRSIAVDGEDICCCYVVRTDGTEEDFSLFKLYRRRDPGNRFDSNTGRVYRRSSKIEND